MTAIDSAGAVIETMTSCFHSACGLFYGFGESFCAPDMGAGFSHVPIFCCYAFVGF